MHSQNTTRIKEYIRSRLPEQHHYKLGIPLKYGQYAIPPFIDVTGWLRPYEILRPFHKDISIPSSELGPPVTHETCVKGSKKWPNKKWVMS